MALILTATVLMISALAVIAMTTSSIEGFKNDKDSLGDTGCEFQEEQGGDLTPGCEENTDYTLEDRPTVYAT